MLKFTNKSPVQLLKESGYLEQKGSITKDKIFSVLKSYPGFIDDWTLYSDDKRTNSGWYFQQRDTDKWVVGYFSGSRIEIEQEQIYTSTFEACTIFILAEIETLLL